MLTAIYTPLDKICGPKEEHEKKGREETEKNFSLFSAHTFKRGENMDKVKKAIRILPNLEKDRKQENAELMENR